MTREIDDVDEQILYYLTREARHTSAPDIAEQVDVSPPTVRNRIRRLEEDGIINGYHAHVNYEADGRLTNLFICSTSATDRQELAQRVLDVPGVINVREIMTGKGDLQVKVIGTDTDDLTRIAQDITALGIEINDEGLVHREYFRPYAQFGPREKEPISPVTGVAGLSGDADVIEVIVKDGAPIAGKTLQQANEESLIPSSVLVVRIDRDEQAITPTGETTIEVNDFVTVHSRSGITDETLAVFTSG
ncbi:MULTISPECIES: Lrp/AsnC family transcriptional regulator [Natrinema]|uniref:Putative transcriptional regulator, AsnC family protein n=1 Tax=Natrinema gari JCM 14663 TaxID=1230459 RepID=L9ZDD3_9EURY|nr:MULTISPECIES: Lrp/AsnC family transcriptional regulator [Natrinema]AFO56267.1 putative transcriptional regulator, AsnC family protein [Natrinema sp. J7-2]ELY83188.1 putative transcriptional regulator, AsnC family protein [Natrinema gari JCM 14663]